MWVTDVNLKSDLYVIAQRLYMDFTGHRIIAEIQCNRVHNESITSALVVGFLEFIWEHNEKSNATNSILGYVLYIYIPLVKSLELGVVGFATSTMILHKRICVRQGTNTGSPICQNKIQFTRPSCVHVHVEVLQWFPARSIRGSPQIETQKRTT